MFCKRRLFLYSTVDAEKLTSKVQEDSEKHAELGVGIARMEDGHYQKKKIEVCIIIQTCVII